MRFAALFLVVIAACSTERPEVAPVAVREDQPAEGPKGWPMFGGSPSRNMVNPIDKGVTLDFSVEEGKLRNVKWVVELGSKCYGGPIVTGGKVYVGTNDTNPSDPKANLAVL